MKSPLAIFAGLFLSTNLAFAQPAAPAGPPPSFIVVVKTVPEKGHLVYVIQEPVTEQYAYTETIKVEGKDIDVTKFKSRTVYKSVIVTMDISNSRIITPDGKQLPIDEVWKRAKAGTVFVRSADEKTPDQAFLRALNAETMVFIPSAIKKQPPPEPEKKP